MQIDRLPMVTTIWIAAPPHQIVKLVVHDQFRIDEFVIRLPWPQSNRFTHSQLALAS